MTTPSFSFTQIFIFFSIISIPSIPNVEADEPYEFVNQVCSKLNNTDFCLEVLKSDPGSMYAKDVTTLTKIAVGVATKNSTATRDYFRNVKSGPPGVLKSLPDCIGAYNFVVSSLSNCLKEEDCSLIGYDIHQGGDEVRRCQATADSNRAHDSFITSSNKVIEEFCELGESLANLMCKR